MEESFSQNVKQLEQQLREIGSERSVYEKEIAAYAKENSALKEKVARLHASILNDDAKTVQTLKEVRDLHKKKADLREKEFKTTIKEKENSIQDLQEKLRCLKREVEKSKLLDKENQSTRFNTSSQITTLKDKVNALEKECTTKDKQFNATKTELNKKCSQQLVTIKVLEDQLKTARFEKDSANRELAQHKVKLNSDQMRKDSALQKHSEETRSLQSQLKSMQNELNKNRDKHSQVAEEVNVLRDENKSLRLKNENREKSLNEKVLRLQEDLTTKETQIKLITRQLNIEKSKSQDVNSELQSKQARTRLQLEQLEEECRERNLTINQISDKLKESESSLRSLKLKHQREVISLQDDASQLSRQLQDKDAEICSLNNKIISLEKKDEKVSSKRTAKMERLQFELDQLTDENSTKERKLQKLKRDVEQMDSELRGKENQYQLKIQSLERNFGNLRKENQAKEEEINKISAKLSGLETESESSTVKSRIRSQTLEDKVKRLEKELKLKDNELQAMSGQMSDQQFEVESLSSRQNTRVKTLEEKIVKLEAENKNKEDQLCQVSFKLANEELELGSVSSKYRVQVRTQEDRIEKQIKQLEIKDEKIVELETELSENVLETNNLKSRVRRLELEKKRKENDLCQLQSLEAEQTSKSEESLNRIKRLEGEKRKLEAEVSELRLNSELTSEKLNSAESELHRVNVRLEEKEKKISKMNSEVKSLKSLEEDMEQKRIDEDHLENKIKSLTSANRELKTELERLNEMKLNLVRSVEDLSEKLKREEEEKKILKQTSFSVSSKLDKVEAEQSSLIEKQKKEIVKLKREINEFQDRVQVVEGENVDLEGKCRRLEIDNSLQSKKESQLSSYKEKLEELKKANSELHEKQEDLHRDNNEMKRTIKRNEEEKQSYSQKIEDLEKTNEILKETCMMLEKQVDDLESFNNELIEKENVLSAEKSKALRRCSELRLDLSSSKNQLEAELNSLDQNSNDQITQLQVELRNEINNLHEVNEQYHDLQQKYKNLELNAGALQRKLKIEKDGHDRCMSDLRRTHADTEILRESLRRAEENLHVEVDRCDALERERTHMLNRIDTDKLEFSHELVRLNCQGAQQAKLIDFLQSRVEELEAADKKKKKKKTTLYQAPLQYRELLDLLEEEKGANVKLQEQVNNLRSELQSINSKMKRMKHGMETPLSPGSIAAISAIVKSPAATPANVAVSPKAGKQRSKPRMHHNIPHRLSSWVCNRASRCSVCLSTIRFGHTALLCTECSLMCHNKCRSSVTNTCGLPGGLFEQFKEGAKPSNPSPITSVFRGSNSDQLHGRLKVLCGDDSWVIRSVRVFSDHIRIAPPTAKSPSKLTDKDDVIDLKQAAYVQTDLNQSELPNTTKQDLSYAFKVQSGSSSSCWPARTVYFLAANFAEKHLWIEKLEATLSRHSQARNISGNAKIFGNEILTLLGDEKLELNCSVPVSEKTILFGCDEGLFRLSPSTRSSSSKADMKRVDGVGSIHQLTALSKSKIIAIEGPKHRLVLFNCSSIESNNTAVLQPIENVVGCHLITSGKAEGLYYLCVASATAITILKFNEKMKKFCKKKEIATTEPCTCMLFTACSIIIGSNNFYEVDLTEYRIDAFIDEDLVGRSDIENVFPVAILKIKERDGKQEFLLCYHEFGLFVDGFGHPTRAGRIVWSRMPLSFEYREPYLIIAQFNSLEILLLDVESLSSAENSKLDRAILSFPRVRYLGSAITEGAVYLSSNNGGRTSVFCCKGNMKQTKFDQQTSASKRHLAALSSSLDSLSSPTSKRPSYTSDVSSVPVMKSSNRFLSKSQQSLESDTSKWSTSEVDDAISCLKSASESYSLSSLDEESEMSESGRSQESVKLQWRPPKTPPPKPSRRARAYDSKYDPISSTQV